MARFRMAKPLCPVATGRGYCAFTVRSGAPNTLDQRSRLACFHALLDPEQHPPFHQEVRDLHEHPVCHGTHATWDAAAGDQACSARPNGFQGERTPALEPECASQLEHTHPQPARRMQVDGFAELAMLPLRTDAVGVLHLAPGGFSSHS